MKVILIVYLLFGLFLDGCVQSTAIPSKPDLTIEPTTLAYPVYEISGNGPNEDSASYPSPIKEFTDQEINNLVVADPPDPEVNLSSISGLIINNITKSQLGNTDIYLTRAVGENNDAMPPILLGRVIEKGDIAGKTLEDGTFVFSNIPPGNYFLIVSMDLSPCYKTVDAPSPLLIKALPGNSLNLGVIFYNSN